MTKTKACELNSVLIQSVVTLNGHLIPACVGFNHQVHWHYSGTAFLKQDPCSYPQQSTASCQHQCITPPTHPCICSAPQQFRHFWSTVIIRKKNLNKTPTVLGEERTFKSCSKCCNFINQPMLEVGCIQNLWKFLWKRIYLSSWTKMSTWQRRRGMEEMNNIDT